MSRRSISAISPRSIRSRTSAASSAVMLLLAASRSWRYPTFMSFTPDPRPCPVRVSASVAHCLADLLGHLFSVAQEHHCIVAVEQRVVDAGVTGGEAALIKHHRARLPDLKHWHAVD